MRSPCCRTRAPPCCTCASTRLPRRFASTWPRTPAPHYARTSACLRACVPAFRVRARHRPTRTEPSVLPSPDATTFIRLLPLDRLVYVRTSQIHGFVPDEHGRAAGLRQYVPRRAPKQKPPVSTSRAAANPGGRRGWNPPALCLPLAARPAPALARFGFPPKSASRGREVTEQPQHTRARPLLNVV